MKKWLMLAGIVVLFDQLTKHWVVAELYLHERINILPMFDITLAYNKGAAFSFLADAGGWQRWLFTGIAVVVAVVLTVWLSRLKESEKWLACALALILGGAIGNVYDRIVLGHVVDFLLFYWPPDKFFPAFNVADSAISLGAMMMIFDMFRGESDPDAEQEKGHS